MLITTLNKLYKTIKCWQQKYPKARLQSYDNIIFCYKYA